MTEKQEAINFCMTFKDVYKDTPFRDTNWVVIRHNKNKKVFAWIFERGGHIWINIKNRPEWLSVRREIFPSVLPAYHLNKEHWNSIILDGTVPEEEIKEMIAESYELTKPKK